MSESKSEAKQRLAENARIRITRLREKVKSLEDHLTAAERDAGQYKFRSSNGKLTRLAKELLALRKSVLAGKIPSEQIGEVNSK